MGGSKFGNRTGGNKTADMGAGKETALLWFPERATAQFGSVMTVY